LIDDVRIQKEAKELNTDRNLINFANGVYNIDTHQMMPHDSKYLQTIQVPHEVKTYKPFEETRLYEFLKGQCNLPDEDIDMIMRYMAYCLTLDYGLKTFMILQGQSNTGKSVLIRFFEHLVGKFNTSSLSMHELNMRFYPTQLYNKLLNSCADNSSLPLSSIDNLKKVTGGDSIMFEKKGNPVIFFFVSFAKLLFSFNQMPLQLEEKSNAFYKRMRVLCMNKELFLNNEYVEALCSEESITETIPYLLSLLPLKEIPATATSNKMVDRLRRDSDSTHDFFSKHCVTGGTKWCTKRDLYDAYTQFCIDSGREAHKKHSFNRHMILQGYTEARHPKTREACWRGIGLKKKR
jgi:P4 family phage/plasmid primase-like protien